MRRTRNAKIVATLGPASSSAEMVAALFAAGADVFRLNFSHGSREDHRARHALIRDLERKHDRPIGILADLQGPKLRIGVFAHGKIDLADGARFRLDLDERPGDRDRVALPHPEIFHTAGQGAELLLDDGRIRLMVIKAGADFLDCEVRRGGRLSNHKGVNVPGVLLPISAITRKDENDLGFALELGVDWVGLSFVQRPEDVAAARRLIGNRAGLLAKIEKPSALQYLYELVELADALMVARGDLGVEMPVEEVPGLQKRIIRAARRAGKPVVVATQMLESMTGAPQPTRAEVSDVATAVYDGADAVMLSAETASGDFPVAAVEVMSRVIGKVERDPLYRSIMLAEHTVPEPTAADAITAAARQVAETIRASAIVTYTATGSTALRASRERPQVPILSLTPLIATARRLTIAWGLHVVLSGDAHRFAEMVRKGCQIAKRDGFAVKGDRIVITAGVPVGTPGTTNILRIAWIDA